ncbi:MAG: oligosaccharide flippase family protein [Bacteroidales bacterium]|nr:oligosaccharide flippase family protein [Bacteroidales bacterium]
MNQWSKYIEQLISDIRKKGFFHLLSANLMIQLVAFASQLFVAGILSPEDIGRIKIIQTFLSVFSVVAGMGFNASTLKLCSENRTKEEGLQLFRSALAFTLISTITIYTVVLILNVFGVFSSDTLIQWLIPIGLFPLISNSLFMVFVSYFQATKQIKLMSGITMTNKIISILAIVLLAYWFGIKGYYIAYNLSFIVMLFVSFRVIRKDFSFGISTLQLKSLFPVHWKYARPSIFANLLSEISAYIDILLINYLTYDMQEIGFYSFALTLTVALRVFPATVQQIANPYFSGLANNKPEFKKVFARYNKQLYLIVVLTLVFVLLVVPPFINLIFDGKYDASMPYFTFLASGWSIRQLIQLQSAAIFGLGKISYNAYISLISMIFNIAACSLLIHYFGVMGAAYASIPSGIVILSASYYFMQKALKQD